MSLKNENVAQRLPLKLVTVADFQNHRQQHA